MQVPREYMNTLAGQLFYINTCRFNYFPPFHHTSPYFINISHNFNYISFIFPTILFIFHDISQ